MMAGHICSEVNTCHLSRVCGHAIPHAPLAGCNRRSKRTGRPFICASALRPAVCRIEPEEDTDANGTEDTQAAATVQDSRGTSKG